MPDHRFDGAETRPSGAYGIIRFIKAKTGARQSGLDQHQAGTPFSNTTPNLANGNWT